MYAVSVQITGYVDDNFPGFVSCALRDAREQTWQFVEKAPIVSLANLTRESTHPQAGEIRCKVLSRSVDASGKAIAQIDTASPDAVESEEGHTVFEVFAEQLVEAAGDA